MNEILIEAEGFKNKGGWVIDQQSMETIHSAYLMAHGMGIPVEDAYTEFEITKNGKYFVWALTRDWTAIWEIKDSAGKFRIKIDGVGLENILGTNNVEWGWQLAGSVNLTQGTHTIALNDLTGFNGRCDAIYITDSESIPSSDISDIDEMRKRLNWKEIKEIETDYDLVVVGGGIAGICTALSAVRSGVKAVLINDRPVLGGCNSSEIRVCMGGHIKLSPYENIGDVVREIAPVMGHPTIYKEEYFEDSRKKLAFEVSNGNVMLNEAVTAIEKQGNEITAVICTNIETGKKTKVKSKMFSDCSGDGILARLGGAELMYGREAGSVYGESLAPKEHQNLVMGHSIRWYSEEQEDYSTFPDLNWNLDFDNESFLNCFSGDWEQESGFTRNMVSEIEYIRDYGLRAIYANWSFQKNRCSDKEKFAKSKLKWVSAIGGKRESYRVKGDYVLTQHDLEEQIEHKDGTAAVTWGIDMHFPEPVNEEKFGEAFRSFAYHRGMPAICPVPYRCLYSKDINNLFIGGRLISTSHVAFSAIRVMRTLGMLGEVAGLAAAVCKNHGCTPREVYKNHFGELQTLMKNGVHIPSSFACGEINDSEAYHFKDIGWWRWHINTGGCDNSYYPATGYENQVEKFKKCINHLGINHKYPMPQQWT